MGGRGANIKLMNRAELADKSRSLFKEKMKAKRSGTEFTKQKQLDSVNKRIAEMDKKRKEENTESAKISMNQGYAADRDFTTTTYDRARKRRMRNFDSWFYGGRS